MNLYCRDFYYKFLNPISWLIFFLCRTSGKLGDILKLPLKNVTRKKPATMGFEGCGVFGVLAMRIRVWLAMSINYEHKARRWRGGISWLEGFPGANDKRTACTPLPYFLDT